MTRQELKQWREDNVEARPYNKKGEIDGNHNYIHRTKVAELLFKLDAARAE